jgi:nucleotide-binding universal stress UspA family protein
MAAQCGRYLPPGIARCFYWEETMAGTTDRSQGRIVVGVDGTTASAAAVRWAVREALLRQASVHLVFADDHDRRIRAPYAGRWNEPRPDEDTAAATALCTAEQQASQALPPARLSSERADGSPSRVLIDRSAGAEMLVLGSAYQARRSASDAWPPMGPVTRACLHSAACPVVVMAACEGACTPDV